MIEDLKVLNNNYASVGGASRHTVVVLCVCHYASVGGATRHTVVVLCVCVCICPLPA